LAVKESSAEILLSLSAVTAGYGAGLILKGVNLEVRQGEIICLIGPNGAGKSTVLKTVSGLLRPRSGSVTFAGEEIGNLTSRDRLTRGIVHVPQDRSLFPAMTVWENVMMGAFILTDQALVRQRLDEVAEQFPIVAKRRSSAAGSLSGGEQKQVELARSLMLDLALPWLIERRSSRPGWWRSRVPARACWATRRSRACTLARAREARRKPSQRPSSPARRARGGRATRAECDGYARQVRVLRLRCRGASSRPRGAGVRSGWRDCRVGQTQE
jgi:ABC-type lipoprotein export system ATPase subunit